FEQAMLALGRLADGPLAANIAEALRRAGPELGKRLIAAAAGAEPTAPRSPCLSEADSAEQAARRAMALRLAALAGADGVVDTAIRALAEDLLAEPAQATLAALGPSALPVMFQRLADSAISPEARAALVDVVADILGAGDPSASPRPAALEALRGAVRDPERQIAVRAVRALAHLGNDGDLALV